jgi:hypothetical protein
MAIIGIVYISAFGFMGTGRKKDAWFEKTIKRADPILCALFIFQDGQVGNNEYGDNLKKLIKIIVMSMLTSNLPKSKRKQVEFFNGIY